MGKVIRPVFGKPCYDCGAQVPMRRVRIIESDAAARGAVPMTHAFVCVGCQQLRENEERRARRAEGARDITIIRG